LPATSKPTRAAIHGPGSNSLYLVEDRAPKPGEMFIWCQKSFDGFPTADQG
jgi:hypothetical protein